MLSDFFDCLLCPLQTERAQELIHCSGSCHHLCLSSTACSSCLQPSPLSQIPPWVILLTRPAPPLTCPLTHEVSPATTPEPYYQAAIIYKVLSVCLPNLLSSLLPRHSRFLYQAPGRFSGFSSGPHPFYPQQVTSELLKIHLHRALKRFDSSHQLWDKEQLS